MAITLQKEINGDISETFEKSGMCNSACANQRAIYMVLSRDTEVIPDQLRVLLIKESSIILPVLLIKESRGCFSKSYIQI